MLKRVFFGAALLLIGFGVCAVSPADAVHHGPTLLVSPTTGTFEIGEVFTVNIAINTKGQTINAFKVKLHFQPDKLQVVSPSSGQSIAGLWVRRPSYSNETGEIDFEGAIPSPGINTDFGILTTITFRAKSLGQATLRFDEESALYLNDGQGTRVDDVIYNGIYSLVLPAPQGPSVSSPTHPDQDRWHAVNDIVLRWNNKNSVEGYSYVLSQMPVDTPDNISEGRGTETVYKGLSDGIYYFHIKALRGSVWGGITHFGIKVQTGAPAEFDVEVNPSTRTSSKTIVFTFETTDQLSGMDHYEAKIIPLTLRTLDIGQGNPLFFEVQSPYIFHVENEGKYEFIVRAFNRAGNYTESSVKTTVTKPISQYIVDGGVRIVGTVIPWYLFWAIVAALIVSLWYLARRLFHWHLDIEFHHTRRREQHRSRHERLDELRRRFSGTKSLALLLLIAMTSLFAGGAPSVNAAELPPPVTNLVSENINNDEIFYIGGRAASGSGGRVIIYLQSLGTGETLSLEASVTPNGDWFYTHPSFIQAGGYLLWTQLKIGDIESPPSAQIQMVVSLKAIQLGASRVSYETLYLAIIIILALAMVALSGAATYWWRKGHRRRGGMMREIGEAKEAIQSGFATLQRDIQAEIDAVREKKHDASQKLLHDLEEIARHVTKEVSDIERMT